MNIAITELFLQVNIHMNWKFRAAGLYYSQSTYVYWLEGSICALVSRLLA